MFEPWILFTIFAAFCQNFRSALQKHLKSKLSTAGAAYVRFVYALPFSALYLWALTEFGGYALPTPNAKFLMFCFLGGLAQILFTVFLVWMFSFRNFAVGTTFSKTETVQVAILGLILLGDTLSLGASIAIAVSFMGVMALSVSETKISVRTIFASLGEKPTLIGLASGFFLGASVVLYRGATLSIPEHGFLMRAGFALTVAVVMQTILMGLFLRWREPGQLTAVFVNWRWAAPVGVAGMLASVGWFSAFAMENAAYVRALGQIELVFTFVASILFFKEKTKPIELAGIAMIVAGILLLLLAR